jgi:hypothetical protein
MYCKAGQQGSGSAGQKTERTQRVIMHLSIVDILRSDTFSTVGPKALFLIYSGPKALPT